MNELERLRKELDRATMQVAEAIDKYTVVKDLYLDELDKYVER